ncbi:FG-GAP repeat protein [Streptomyces sp. NPDC006385]|uniref:FG-GAP repeat protein n=1 Tax=Streptomyces sp. NPDC006385 TaxID=3156761 RepID=UPI0033B9353E
MIVWGGPRGLSGGGSVAIPANNTQTGDFDGDVYADLAARAMGEDNDNGAVGELRGRPTGTVTDAALVSGAGRSGRRTRGRGSGPRCDSGRAA